jgi:hypothetical protein
MAEDVDEGPGRVRRDPGPQYLRQPDTAAFGDAASCGIQLVAPQQADAELDDINGGFLFVLLGAAAFTTGFFAGYGAVRFAQDMSD